MVFVTGDRKRNLLATLLRDPSFDRVLVFTRTKHGADRVVRHLLGAGIEATAIHGNKSQPQRERALAGFRDGEARVLIATDIAARGIDIDGVSHVINFELPNVPEDYVHRIGRTARAGASGIAIAFCSDEERPYLRDIEKLTRRAIPPMPMAWLPAVPDATSPRAAPPQPEPERSSRRPPGRRDGVTAEPRRQASGTTAKRENPQTDLSSLPGSPRRKPPVRSDAAMARRTRRTLSGNLDDAKSKPPWNVVPHRQPGREAP